jgi:hypothetical protein
MDTSLFPYSCPHYMTFGLQPTHDWTNSQLTSNRLVSSLYNLGWKTRIPTALLILRVHSLPGDGLLVWCLRRVFTVPLPSNGWRLLLTILSCHNIYTYCDIKHECTCNEIEWRELIIKSMRWTLKAVDFNPCCQSFQVYNAVYTVFVECLRPIHTTVILHWSVDSNVFTCSIRRERDKKIH